ncbi:MAG: hypothetical protein J6R50_04745 [Alistipes sp.]|nr:hypothetical protein [Alistipes sp.]
MKRLLNGLVISFLMFVAVVVGCLLYLRHCEWCPDKAAKYATERAEKKSLGIVSPF